MCPKSIELLLPIYALLKRQILQSNSYLGDELTRDWLLRKLLSDELTRRWRAMC